MLSKTCSKCGVDKPLDQFYKQKWCRLGVRPDCKACFYADCRARFDPERHRIYSRKYRAKNPNKDREYYERNKDVFLAKSAEYNRKNAAEYNAKLRRWRKNNPEKVQVWVRNRRAKLNGLSGTHTLEDILDLLRSQDSKCVYCVCDISKSFQVDHIVPVSRGGANDKSNLQLLCKPCNLLKRDRDPLEFAQSLGTQRCPQT